MSGAKLAALKLASLSGADRAWVLQKLSAHERKQIEPAMSAVLRLQTHEIESIAQQNRALFHSVKRTKKPELKVSNVQLIRTANIGQIGKALDELDPVCLALFLDSHDWPWLTVYLNWKGPEVRNYLAEVQKQTKGKVSSKFVELIIEKVAQRLRPEAVLPDQKSRFEALLIDGYSNSVKPQGSAVISRDRGGASA